MKIAQLCAVDFTLYHFLAPLMRAIRDAGHDVVGICAEGALLRPLREEGLRVEPVAFVRGYDPRAHWRAYRELTRLFRRERFDIVHVHTPIAGLIGRFAAARVGVPKIVYTAHGFYFHDGMPAWKRQAFVTLEYLGGRVTDLLLTQAEEDAAAARRYGLSRGDVIAIGNGADPRQFFPAAADDPTRRALRRELGAEPTTPVIVMIGRLVAEKGYPELFAAMHDVDAQLWVLGERLKSDHAGSIAALIEGVERDPVLSKHIRFLGYRSDVPAVLRAADVFTLPSHREGMPRSIIEAMLSGLPVVATNIRGAREEVVHGETGFLVSLGDVSALAQALQRLAKDASLRQRLGAASLRRAQTLYDERKIIARQLALLGLTS